MGYSKLSMRSVIMSPFHYIEIKTSSSLIECKNILIMIKIFNRSEGAFSGVMYQVKF